MIDPAILNAYPAQSAGASTGPETGNRPRLHMRRDPDARMAGSIPVWESPVRNNAAPSQTEPQAGSFDDALSSYADVEPAAGTTTPSEDDEFGFGDLVDIVNPLHHIPLVSTLYENITGDTIKPSGRILGGAVFGGFVGAAAGIANVIVQEETGKTVTGNVVALVSTGDLPQAKPQTLSPEEQLDRAAELAFNDKIETQDLPAMAFGLQQPTGNKISEQSHAENAVPQAVSEYERYLFDDRRMAGMAPRHKPEMTSPIPASHQSLVDPVSINLANMRAERAAALAQAKLSPHYNE